MKTTLERSNQSDKRWVLLTEFYFYFFAIGFCSGMFNPPPGLYLLLVLFGQSTITLWVCFDAREKKLFVSHGMQLLIMGTWHIAVPVYLIWSRGPRGAVLAIINGVGLAITCATGTAIAVWLYGDVSMYYFE